MLTKDTIVSLTLHRDVYIPAPCCILKCWICQCVECENYFDEQIIGGWFYFNSQFCQTFILNQSYESRKIQ